MGPFSQDYGNGVLEQDLGIGHYYVKQKSKHIFLELSRLQPDMVVYFVDNDALPVCGDEGYHRLQKLVPIINF